MSASSKSVSVNEPITKKLDQQLGNFGPWLKVMTRRAGELNLTKNASIFTTNVRWQPRQRTTEEVAEVLRVGGIPTPTAAQVTERIKSFIDSDQKCIDKVEAKDGELIALMIKHTSQASLNILEGLTTWDEAV